MSEIPDTALPLASSNIESRRFEQINGRHIVFITFDEAVADELATRLVTLFNVQRLAR